MEHSTHLCQRHRTTTMKRLSPIYRLHLLLIGGSSLIVLLSLSESRKSSAFQPAAAPSFAGSNPRSSSSSSSSIAATKSNNRNNEEAEVGGSDEIEEDFSAWIQGLSEQWPQKPTASSSSSSQEELEDDHSSWIQGLGHWPLRKQDRERQQQAEHHKQLPLTNLLNMEALLALGQQSALNATTAIQLPEGFLSSVVGEESSLSLDSIIAAAAGLENVLNITELSNWSMLIDGLQKSLLGPYGYVQEKEQTGSGGDGGGGGGGAEQKNDQRDRSFAMDSISAEGVLKAATEQVESIVKGASDVLSIKTMEQLIVDASKILTSSSAKNATNFIQAATDYAVEQGMDVEMVTDRAKETIEFSKSFVTVADGVYRKGYVPGDHIADSSIGTKDYNLPESVPPVKGSRALFADFKSATEIEELSPSIGIAAEMGALSGSIYQDSVSEKHELGHTIVATGATDDVRWMVTDSITTESSFQSSGTDNDEDSSRPLLTRTITIRGYDASDGDVDRENLLLRVINGEPTTIPECEDLVFHSGLLDIAKSLYEDLEQFIHWTAPNHKIVLNGHSIGGSLSMLLLFLMTLDLGPDAVKHKIKRVFTFGSPPIVRMKNNNKYQTMSRINAGEGTHHCPILDTFELPSSLVFGFVQPWDPIVRLFTPIDPLYPLVDDVADDGHTLWQSGPPRTLRPVLKTIMLQWGGWPQLRDTFRSKGGQSFSTVGIQHVLVPEPTRYLADRFVAVNIPVPPVEAIVRIAPAELLPALRVAFPLDVFEISSVPQTIRSFVHHFFPAYGDPMVEYVKRLEEEESIGAMNTNSDIDDSQQPHLSTVSSGEAVNGEQQPRDPTSGWNQRFRI